MPRFAVLIYASDSAHDPDATEEDLAEPNAHGDLIAASGVLVAAYAFTPRGLARAVRADGVVDGPFVDGANIVAGVYVIEADDIDAAVDIARTNPAVRGSGGVEVRPVHSGTP
jgi:hypothetical protein